MTTLRTDKRQTKYPFRFKVTGADGKVHTMIVWVLARFASKPVDLVVTADHVKRSIALNGVGNTQNCTMAICTMDHKDSFPHAVDGFVDWTYRRAVVVTALSKRTHMPSRCIVYNHNSRVAHLNDSIGGQKELLRQIERNGPITVHLRPLKSTVGYAPKTKRGAASKNRDAKRSETASKTISAETKVGSKKGTSAAGTDKATRHLGSLGVGAKRRFAVMQLGGFFAHGT